MRNGQLAGLLEVLNSGVTTILDHFQANNTPEHAEAVFESTLKIEVWCLCRILSCPTERGYSALSLGGAEALNLRDQIGSVEVRKRADLILSDALSISLVGIRDPFQVSGIVFHTSDTNVATAWWTERL